MNSVQTDTLKTLKHPSEWMLSDIQLMIDTQREEALTLEYKASASLQGNKEANKEMAKDVSAFANSGGGTIVYGVVEESHKPIRIDEGVNPTLKTRESIENTLIDRIRPKISGLKIHPIDLETGYQIFVIEVPQSKNAPHMAQHKYYKRHNFQSVPMEDYEVCDVMNRQVGPDLQLEISVSDINNKINTSSCSMKVSFDIALRNHGKHPARDVIVTLWIDTRFNSGINFIEESTLQLPDGKTFDSRKYIYCYSSKVTAIYGQHSFGFINPANPHFKRHDMSFDLKNVKKITELEAFIKWQIEAPNMTTRTGIEKVYTSSTLDIDSNADILIENISC